MTYVLTQAIHVSCGRGNMAAEKIMSPSLAQTGDVSIEGFDGRALMLYDGLCGLCNNAVLWVIKHDHADRFRFAPQQSSIAATILAQCGVDWQS